MLLLCGRGMSNSLIGSSKNLDQHPSFAKRPKVVSIEITISQFQTKTYCQCWHEKSIDSDEVDFPGHICHAVAMLEELFVGSTLLVVGRVTDELREATFEKELDSETKTAEPSLPGSEHPEHVQGNVLFKTIKSQAQAQALLGGLDVTSREARRDVLDSAYLLPRRAWRVIAGTCLLHVRCDEAWPEKIPRGRSPEALFPSAFILYRRRRDSRYWAV